MIFYDSVKPENRDIIRGLLIFSLWNEKFLARDDDMV